MRNEAQNLLIIFFLGIVIPVSGQTTRVCKFQEYRCRGGTACLLTEKLCNGVADCPQGEDEKWDCRKPYLSTDCGEQHKFFRCRFGGCIPRQLACNGQINCEGGTDEASDICGESGLRPAPAWIPPLGSENSDSTTRVPARMPPKPIPTRQHGPLLVKPSGPKGRPITCEGLLELEGFSIKCHLRRSRRQVSCRRAVQHGTIATYECKKYYKVLGERPERIQRMCKNGKWTANKSNWACVADCGEGKPEINHLIVGGTISQIGNWPWHVGLYHQNPPNSGKWDYFCGGSLISTTKVLTAAHCVVEKRGLKMNMRLFFGKFYREIRRDDPKVQERKPLRIIVNEYYDPHTFASDIAIITVAALHLTDRVQLVCLPGDRDLKAGDVGTVVGWGKDLDNLYPDELQQAKLPVTTFETCQRAHPTLEMLIKAYSFCAGYRNGTSPCAGDSGGGLVREAFRKWTIYGIVSAGVAKRTGVCDPNYYTVFTRVVKFRDFIEKTLKNSMEATEGVSPLKRIN